MLDRADQITIRAWYGWIPTVRLAKQIRKPVDAVEAEAIRLGLRRPSAAKFEAIEVAEVKAEKQIAKKPRYVDKRGYIPRGMTEEDAEWFKAIYADTDNKTLAKEFGITPKAVVNYAHRLGLLKTPRPRPVRAKAVRPPRQDLWTPEQDAIMVEKYPYQSTASLEPILRKSHAAISQRAKKLGLSKTADCVSESRLEVANRRKDMIGQMRRAADHLRSGDHMTALGILEEALA